MRATPLRQWPMRWFFANERAQGDGAAGVTPGAGGVETHEQRVERVSKRVQQLPTEDFMDMEDMEKLPLRQLRVCFPYPSTSLSLPPFPQSLEASSPGAGIVQDRLFGVR